MNIFRQRQRSIDTKVQSKVHHTEDREAILAHFTDEENLGQERLSDLSRASQLIDLIDHGDGIHIHVSLSQRD